MIVFVKPGIDYDLSLSNYREADIGSEGVRPFF